MIGLPLNFNGTEGPRAQSLPRLRPQPGPLHAAAAWRSGTNGSPPPPPSGTMMEADASRKRRAEVMDRMAAAYILQGALDRLRNLAGR